MNITGDVIMRGLKSSWSTTSGAFSKIMMDEGNTAIATDGHGVGKGTLIFDASKSWTGETCIKKLIFSYSYDKI